jgi:hypothetical protein
VCSVSAVGRLVSSVGRGRWVDCATAAIVGLGLGFDTAVGTEGTTSVGTGISVILGLNIWPIYPDQMMPITAVIATSRTTIAVESADE